MDLRVNPVESPPPIARPRTRRSDLLVVLSVVLPAIALASEPVRLLFAVWSVPGSPLSWQPMASVVAATAAWFRRSEFGVLANRVATVFPDSNCRERSSSPVWVLASVAAVVSSTFARMPSIAYLSLVALIVSLVAVWHGPFMVRTCAAFLWIAALGTPVPPTVLRPIVGLSSTATATAVTSILDSIGTKAIVSNGTAVFAGTDRTVSFHQGLTGLHSVSAAIAAAILLTNLTRVGPSRRKVVLIASPMIGWIVHIGVVSFLCFLAARSTAIRPGAMHVDWISTCATVGVEVALCVPRRRRTSWVERDPQVRD